MKKAKHCDECQWFMPQVISKDEFRCGMGHSARFYVPKHPRDTDWGWKRRCENFNPRPNHKENP